MEREKDRRFVSFSLSSSVAVSVSDMLTATTGHLRNQLLSNDDKEASEGTTNSARVAFVKPRVNANTRSREEWRNLKIKVDATERELVSVLSRPSVREIFAELVDKEKNASSDVSLEKEQRQLGAQLSSLRNVLDRLKNHISKTGEERTYLPTLKLLMETLETDIVTFKQRQRERQMALQTEERQISNELQGWESRFASWDKMKTEKYEKVKICKSGDHRKQFGAVKTTKGDTMTTVDGLLPDVVRFQNYITAHGGRYGTWDDQSHAGFVRIYQKHKDAPSETLAGILHNSFPGADVEEHLRWYETFCRLETEQKKAIRRWKQGRIQRSLMTAEAISSSQDAEIDQQKMDKEHKNDPKTREGKEEERERELKRKDLSSWKEHRKLQELERKDREDREKQVQEELEKKMKHERQERIKLRLVEHARRKKQEEEEEIRRQEEKTQLLEKSRSQTDPKVEAKRAKERDMKIALRRREDVLAKQNSATERQRRLELWKERNPSNLVAPRDPSRLLKPTVGILLRRKAMAEENRNEGEKGRDMAFETTVLPRRHLPSWRKGI